MPFNCILSNAKISVLASDISNENPWYQSTKTYQSSSIQHHFVWLAIKGGLYLRASNNRINMVTGLFSSSKNGFGSGFQNPIRIKRFMHLPLSN